MTRQEAGVWGIVLAGGLSRRMGGPDKALADLGGRSLAAHVVGRLAPQCEGLVLSRNGDAAAFAAFGLPVVADDGPVRAGPLAGVLAGLDWIASRKDAGGHAASCAVDTPFLPLDLVERLLDAARRGGVAAACAVSGGRRHPVAALWPLAARPLLRRLVGQGARGVGAALAELGCAEADWPSEPLDPFFNVNAPADLDRARRMIGG